jgi:hypothetical protein
MSISPVTSVEITTLSWQIGDYERVVKNPKKNMLDNLQLIPGAISEMFASVTRTGTLTLGDRYGLLAATFDENLDPEERTQIDRLLYSVRRGLVHVQAD